MASTITDTNERPDPHRRRPGRLERMRTPAPPLHPSRLAQAAKRVSDITVAKSITGPIKGPR